MANLIEPNKRGEDRRFERHDVRGEGKIEPLDETSGTSEPILVMLQDIARTGVMFQSSQPFISGSFWRLNFVHDGHRIGTQPIVVTHCQTIRDGFYLVGAQFMIEPIVLSALGVKNRQLAKDDLRKAQQLFEASLMNPEEVTAESRD